MIVYFFDYKRVFSHWDEYSHWGEMVKEMLRIDKLYSAPASVLQAHKDYPPAISLFELLWCKFSGKYSEALLIKSLHIFEFSFFIPAISEKFNFKNKVKLISNSLFGILLVFILISFFDLHGVINSIYTDYIMAIILAYSIFIIVFDKDLLSDFSILNYSLLCILMVLTKQMGLPFYMMILYVYVLKLIYDKYFNKDNKKQLIKVFIFMFIIPLLIWKGWDLYVSSMYSLQQFKLSDIKLFELFDIVRGKAGREYQILAASNYLNALKSVNISSSQINLTFINSVFLMIILMYIVYFYGKKYINKNDFINLESIIILGAFGYAFIMLTLYVFNFGEIEGPNIASFDRYMDTYIIFILSLILMIFIRIFSLNYNKNKMNYIILIFLISLLFIRNDLMFVYNPALKEKNKSIYEISGNTINKYTKNSNVYIIAQDSVGDFQYIVKYYASPINVNLKDYNLKKDNLSDEYKKKIKDKILKYDYLFLARLDDKFLENYMDIFDDEIKSGCLYVIKGDKIKLKGC